jgi:hypothetical protein
MPTATREQLDDFMINEFNRIWKDIGLEEAVLLSEDNDLDEELAEVSDGRTRCYD